MTGSPLKLSTSRLTMLTAAAFLIACGTADAAPAHAIPSPTADNPLSAVKGQDTVVFAGGCYWGIQAVFQHVRGVISATSGFSGGSVKDPSRNGSMDFYELVGSGSTGHAESVKVVFDPSVVTFGTLLKVFFSVAHDPTQVNRQGPDEGTQYRSAIFYMTPEQERIAKDYVAQLTAAKTFSRPIATQIVPFSVFYRAPDEHQDYATKYPTQPYIAINDLPKVSNLKKQFPELYSEKPAHS